MNEQMARVGPFMIWLTYGYCPLVTGGWAMIQLIDGWVEGHLLWQEVVPWPSSFWLTADPSNLIGSWGKLPRCRGWLGKWARSHPTYISELPYLTPQWPSLVIYRFLHLYQVANWWIYHWQYCTRNLPCRRLVWTLPKLVYLGTFKM